VELNSGVLRVIKSGENISDMKQYQIRFSLQELEKSPVLR